MKEEGTTMSVIKVSQNHMEQIEKYITFVNERYHKKITKKSLVARIVNNFHQVVTLDDVNDDKDNWSHDVKSVTIDEKYTKMLKTEKERLGKPMYLVLDACLHQFFLDNYNKNVALCQFKHNPKTFAFYYNPKQLKVRKGQLVTVRTHISGQQECVEKQVRVKDVAYVKDARDKYQPVLDIVK